MRIGRPATVNQAVLLHDILDVVAITNATRLRER
jgi:hypothetical protein